VTERNKHGLSRNIPDDVKYAIRKASGFGCVACGIAIGQYEHIEPSFSETTEHNPENMTFLCAQCHYKVTEQYVSKETVWEWKKKPWCKQKGHCHESFDIGSKEFYLWVGGAKIKGIRKILTMDDNCVLEIIPPEEDGSPYRLSAIFHDENDNKVLEIVNNEWFAASFAFDIICKRGKVGIKTEKGFALKLLCFPPKAIVIERVNMLYKGFNIVGDRQLLYVDNPKGGELNIGGRLLTSEKKESSLFTFSSKQKGLQIGGGITFSGLDENMPSLPTYTHKCRRNQECPCGSKKKYKKCCYDKYDYTL